MHIRGLAVAGTVIALGLASPTVWAQPSDATAPTPTGARDAEEGTPEDEPSAAAASDNQVTPAAVADEEGGGQEPVASAPDSPASNQCPRGWEEAAYKEAVESVVRVKTANGWGAGFFFEDTMTVVTALHVVETGRTVQVVARTGEIRRARVVHNANQDIDLAVLELERPFDSFRPEPLERSPLTPTIAMPVMMIGHPGPDEEGWSVSWGRVGSEKLQNGAIEVDGTANPGNSGGPLLDCSGRVLGVVSYLKDTGITMAVPINDLPRRHERRFRIYKGAFAAAVRFPNVVYSAEDKYHLWGVGLGGDFVIRDRWVTALQGHYQWWAKNPGGSTIELTERRWQIELYEEFRVLAWGYLGVGFGGALSWDKQRFTWGSIDDTTTPSSFVVHYHRDQSVRLRPMVTASWALRPFYVGYAYQIDTLKPDLSSHRLLFGIRAEDVMSYK